MREIAITTLTSAATLDGECTDQRTCPSVHVIGDRPAVYHVVVTAVTDPAERAAFAHLVGPGEVVLPMQYSDEGSFLRAEVADPEQVDAFRSDRDRAWTAAEPFAAWWARHSELHRVA